MQQLKHAQTGYFSLKFEYHYFYPSISERIKMMSKTSPGNTMSNLIMYLNRFGLWLLLNTV